MPKANRENGRGLTFAILNRDLQFLKLKTLPNNDSFIHLNYQECVKIDISETFLDESYDLVYVTAMICLSRHVCSRSIFPD